METARLRAIARELIKVNGVVGVDLAELARAIGGFKELRLADGVELYREGATSDSMHVLLSGSVRVTTGPEQREVARIPAPAVIGHLGVLAGLRRSATLITEGPVLAASIDQRRLWELLQGGTPPGRSLRRLLLGSLSRMMHSANDQIASEVSRYGEIVAAAPPSASRPDRRPEPPTGEAHDDDPLPSSPPPGRGRARSIQDLENAFDADLLEEADQVSVVRTAADDRLRHRR